MSSPSGQTSQHFHVYAQNNILRFDNVAIALRSQDLTLIHHLIVAVTLHCDHVTVAFEWMQYVRQFLATVVCGFIFNLLIIPLENYLLKKSNIDL